MKKITLLISDKVYKEIKKSQGVRKLTGSSYGIKDEFISKLIESIEDGKS